MRNSENSNFNNAFGFPSTYAMQILNLVCKPEIG